MRRATKFITAEQRARLIQMSAYRGLFARLARELNLGKNGRSHVRKVAIGERRSRRIEAALHEALSQIESQKPKKHRRAA